MALDIFYFQLATVLIWGIACVVLFPSLYRAMAGWPRKGDAKRSALLVAGLLFIGASALSSSNYPAAMGLVHACEALLGVCVLLILWNERPR